MKKQNTKQVTLSPSKGETRNPERFPRAQAVINGKRTIFVHGAHPAFPVNVVFLLRQL